MGVKSMTSQTPGMYDLLIITSFTWKNLNEFEKNYIFATNAVPFAVACDEGNDTFNNGKESPGTGTSIKGEHDDKKVCSTFEQTISTAITFYQFKR